MIATCPTSALSQPRLTAGLTHTQHQPCSPALALMRAGLIFGGSSSACGVTIPKSFGGEYGAGDILTES